MRPVVPSSLGLIGVLIQAREWELCILCGAISRRKSHTSISVQVTEAMESMAALRGRCKRKDFEALVDRLLPPPLLEEHEPVRVAVERARRLVFEVQSLEDLQATMIQVGGEGW
jgi:hypothetical protein